MTIDDKIRDEKLQYDFNREATKISALSPGKIDQRRVIEQVKFAYSPLGKPEKTIEELEKKQMLLQILTKC